jgi:hypothetical protein
MYYQMAYRVLWYYVGQDWAHANVSLKDKENSFTLNSLGNGDEERGLHYMRIIDLADVVFQLRSCKGFDIFLKRLTARDTQVAYEEGEAAALFDRSGYSVEFFAEAGMRGSDFDFRASKLCQCVSVEVTHLENDVFSARSLENKLAEKRTQVPRSHPAALCIWVKPSWADDPDVEAVTEGGLKKFFRGSRRFGAVLVMFDRWFTVQGGRRMFARARVPYVHPGPYHPLPDIEFVHRNTLATLLGTVDTKAERMNKAELKGPLYSLEPSFVRWCGA